MSANELAIERMCELAWVSRRSFYRFDPETKPADRDMDLRDAIQRIALEMPSYGRPRITAELRRRGWVVNGKRVHRIMREDNLLCLRRHKFLVTTDSRHGFPIYPNLAGQLQLSNVNQLWIADITYIRLETEFVYLAIVLDAFSRRVIGWALDRTLEAKLTVAALEMALSRRKVQAGLVHHSDRGVQYTAISFGKRLEEVGIIPSMGRTGSALDNAMAESFIATLKTELVHRRRFPDREVARSAIFEYLEGFYNRRRLHSALSYRSPTDYEEATMEGVAVA